MKSQKKKTALKLDLESKFAEIQTQLKVHDRPPYDCPKEFKPETLDSAFDALWNAEKKHGNRCREQRFKFIKKEQSVVSADKVEEMKESYKHFDKDNDGSLDKQEFKAALSAMSIPVKDDAALDALIKSVSGGGVVISEAQWIKYNMELAEDKDTPEQIKASFKTLADDRDSLNADNLRVPPLTAEDVEYLIQAMPKDASGGMDYNAFVDQSFVKHE